MYTRRSELLEGGGTYQYDEIGETDGRNETRFAAGDFPSGGAAL
jgi:hypothetical protein